MTAEQELPEEMSLCRPELFRSTPLILPEEREATVMRPLAAREEAQGTLPHQPIGYLSTMRGTRPEGAVGAATTRQALRIPAAPAAPEDM